MDHREVGRLWDGNADAWTKLSRAGYDIYRDWLNTPAFLGMLPDVRGLAGLDIGCGEGHNTRLLAQRGARMTGIDISARFIAHAQEAEARDPLGIRYATARAVELPFPDASFDFATAFMSLMDMPEHDLALAQAFRVLRPGGFLQFSITHPCFNTPHRKLLRDEHGKEIALEVGGYFQNIDGRIEEWHFGAAPPEVKATLPKFKVPRFHRTVSSWLNLLIDAGFTIERLAEPFADEDTARRCPGVADTRLVAYFLHVRARKE